MFSRSAASDIAGPQLHGLENDLKTSRTTEKIFWLYKKNFTSRTQAKKIILKSY